jgi:hypothetical protein
MREASDGNAAYTGRTAIMVVERLLFDPSN